MDPAVLQKYWCVFVLVGVWEATWKAIALWKSARNSDKPWFVVLFILNTVGILPIAYIYIFSKRQKTAQ